ncbi:uncharacterized protein LOC141648512 [Silene latifolia]|uniref:uncharacterized protein LOC141648512 n=1 Tax=Silene latifolia TaxID=37657 RepID=UPI003D771023
MNNSVVSKVNVIDAIIILTGAKFILHPILSNLSMKLPQYDFNHLLKLKPPTQNPKPKPDPICLDLPDDVIVSILSKVDIVTLRRCTLVLSLDSILPQIVSFSTPLDPSLFFPDKSGCWYGRLFNKFVSKAIPFLGFFSVSVKRFLPAKVISVTLSVFLWVNTAQLKPEAVNFFDKLTGLKLLEVELPAMPCYDCRVSPHLWFRWEAKFGIHGSVSDYILFVFADKANDSDSDSDQFLKGMKTVLYHTMFHGSMLAELGYQGNDWKTWKTGLTFMSKDAEGNGGMMIGPQSMRNDGEFRFKILQLPSTLKFSRYTNEEEDPVQVQDVMLLFLAHVDASVVPDDNDVIMACLGDQKTEIREIVAQILADENCLGL